jgi:hypothetical protein
VKRGGRAAAPFRVLSHPLLSRRLFEEKAGSSQKEIHYPQTLILPDRLFILWANEGHDELLPTLPERGPVL